MNDLNAADYCPCCGQPRETNADLERHGLILRGYTLIYNGKRERMRPGVAKLCRAVMERGRATHEMIALRVNPNAESNLVQVYAHFLRKHLAKLTDGAVILNNVHSWGFELIEADAERLAA